MIAALLLAATVTLAWDPSPDGGPYRLYQSSNAAPFMVVSGWPGTTATALYDPLVTNRWYVVTYKTNYAVPESLPSNIVTLLPLVPGAPAPPTNLRISAVQGNRYDLSWVSQIAYSTAVERAPPGGAFSQLALVPPGTMHYTADIKPHQSWLFRVRACGSGCGEPSAAILVRR